jgi:hypothetical protein
MADEAFALSPISARATQPSEEDYEAIREAFMETSRGRWFLSEYAKRNRNADTRMVLDAVARIEENLAAQRVASDGELAEALAAIRKAVDEARAAASIAIDGLALEQSLAPIRKGARVVREIAWRWREIGTDGRICDLLDSQAGAIEAGCGQVAAIDPKRALSAALDLIAGRIAELGDPMPSQTVEEATASPSPSSPSPSSPSTPPDEMPTAVAAAAAPAAAIEQETAMDIPAVAADEEIFETDGMPLSAEAADADDDAVLEMVALEMAAPDPLDAVPEMQAVEPPAAAPKIMARQPEPAAAPAKPPAPPPSLQAAPPPSRPSPQPSLQPSPQPSPQHSLQPALEPSLELVLEPVPEPSLEASLEPSLEPSLGSTLIASGILSKPRITGPDPLAPIRRLSQAEKIAFFS